MLKTILIAVLSSFNLVAQSADSIKGELQDAISSTIETTKDTSSTRLLLELTDKMFGWDIKENDYAYLMAVDIPYPDYFNPKDYFSITVVKFKGKDRPKVISFAVSDMVDTSKGISIFFADYDGSHQVTMSNTKFEKERFTDFGDGFIKLSADFMYLENDEKKDLLKPMNENSHMLFFFYGIDGQHYRIGYPLSWFTSKMKELK